MKPSESGHCLHPGVCDKTGQCENWLTKREGCQAAAVREPDTRSSERSARRWLGCAFCESFQPDDFYPSHCGSVNCKSGSLASGGDNAHCTCDTCF